MNQFSTFTMAVVLAITGLSACDGDNSEPLIGDGLIVDDTSPANSITSNSTDTSLPAEPAASEIDGLWLSDCLTRNPLNPVSFEQEYLVIGGSSYERTINYYQDSDCSVPSDISFLRVQSTDLQFPDVTVQTAFGSASQMVVTAPTIDFDNRLLTDDEAGLYDPALYFYNFYLQALDGRLRFGSMDTTPADQFEQTIDSPHVFTAQ